MLSAGTLSGDILSADSMAKAIEDAFVANGLIHLDEETAEAAEQRRKTFIAISTGVIQHLTANLEVYGIHCQGDIHPSVTGNTGTAAPSNHAHGVNLTGSENGVVFTQNNDGAGHVR